MYCELVKFAELLLANNTRGTVVDIEYDAAGYGRGQLPLVWVRFPSWKGPPFLPEADRRDWVPIVAVKCRCDSGCCERFGLPLTICKADSVHCMQGMTCGDDMPIKRIVIDWSKKAESKWPGALYVALSRAKREHNLALHGQLAESDLRFDRARSQVWRSQTAEMERVTSAALQARATRLGTVAEFCERVLRFCALLSHRLERVRAVIPEARAALIDACIVQWRASATAFLNL